MRPPPQERAGRAGKPKLVPVMRRPDAIFAEGMVIDPPRGAAVRLALFADLQAHDWQRGNELNRNRLADVLSCVRSAYDVAGIAKADKVIFLGDLIESKGTVRTDVASSVYHEVIAGHSVWREARQTQCSTVFIETILIEGNHDQFSGGSTLQPFIEIGGMRVALGPEEGLSLHAFSSIAFGYRKNAVGVPKSALVWARQHTEPGIAFSHLPLKGMQIAPGIEDEPDASLSAVYDALPGVVFQGHYHRPKEVKWRDGRTVIVVGAPMHHDWSDLDAPNDRGCVVADCLLSKSGELVGVEYQRVVFDHLPRFVSDAAKARPGLDFVLPLAEEPEPDQESIVSLEQTYDAGTILEAYLRDRHGLGPRDRLSAEQEALLAEGHRLMAGEEA